MPSCMTSSHTAQPPPSRTSPAALLTLLFAASAGDDTGAEHRADEVGRRGEGPAQLLVDDGGVEHRKLAHVEQAQLAELEPELLRVANCVILELAHDVHPAVAGTQAAHRLPQQLLFGREVEIQEGPPFRA